MVYVGSSVYISKKKTFKLWFVCPICIDCALICHSFVTEEIVSALLKDVNMFVLNEGNVY